MLILLDADGTLSSYRQGSTAPFERILLPGVKQKCQKLLAKDHVLAIASNQGGARKGREGRLTFGAVHAHMRWLCSELGVTTYRFATVPPRKKPAPAMLLELMQELGFEPDETVFVGDSKSDKKAADAAGCQFFWAEQYFEVT